MIVPASKIMLAPLSALYGMATRARLALYHQGAFSVERIEAPVISVGNVTAGGTGKTPLVAWLARAVALEGKRACILTRGYGRENPKARVLVSDGERVLAGARESGDEPLMLALMLKGVAAVVCDANRVEAARWAMKNLNSEVFILDDGFQHLRIARDLDIVTVDAMNPWGGKHLLPRGTLREPLAGLRRASCLVITRADQSTNLESLRADASRLSGGRPIFLSHTKLSRVRPLFSKTNHQAHSIHALTRPFAAFCAIGNPQAFFKQIEGSGITPAYTRAFSDHHVYTQSEIDRLSAEAQARGAQTLLTTAKDAVKLCSLDFQIPCYVLEIELAFDEEEGLLDQLREAIKSKDEG
jgi:tetraacyldisaccharide 4'-kinase